MSNLFGGCQEGLCYQFLHRCSVANVINFLLDIRVLQAPANEQLVASFLHRMGGDNEISWDWKLRVGEGMILVWLDGRDMYNANGDV